MVALVGVFAQTSHGWRCASGRSLFYLSPHISQPAAASNKAILAVNDCRAVYAHCCWEGLWAKRDASYIKRDDNENDAVREATAGEVQEALGGWAFGRT